MGSQCVGLLADTLTVIFRLIIEQLEWARTSQSSAIEPGPPVVAARL